VNECIGERKCASAVYIYDKDLALSVVITHVKIICIHYARGYGTLRVQSLDLLGYGSEGYQGKLERLL
jgi:hypothetical protein